MSDHVALAADLAVLTEALVDPDVDLTVEVDILSAHAAEAIESYLGLSLRVDVAPHPFHLTRLTATGTAQTVRTSLRFPLTGPDGEPTAVSVTLFGGTPGAFVDLGADLAFMFGLDADLVVLDRHLDVPVVDGSSSNLHDVSVINQAVGVLIERGDVDAVSAYVSLAAVAQTAAVSIAVAAVGMVASVATGSPPLPPGRKG